MMTGVGLFMCPRFKVGDHYGVDLGKGWQFMVTDLRPNVEYYVNRVNDDYMRKYPVVYETIKRKPGFSQGHIAASRMLTPYGPRQTEICNVVAAVVTYMDNIT